MTQGLASAGSEVRDSSAVRGSPHGYKMLILRSGASPMKLYPRVREKLDDYFSMYGLTYLSGQREMLAEAAEAVLQAFPGTVTAIPFQPGLGKSTLIRALLEVFSNEFRQNTPIGQALGGVVVVVEKTAEAEELEALCNGTEPGPIIARAISSPNDYNLAQGKCPNGTATTYEECPGRNCSDFSGCRLAQSASQVHDTPILIMLHARYQRYMENMTPFLTWEDDAGEHDRTLLLVDELPPMIEDNALNLGILNKIEAEFDQFKPSYQTAIWKEKTSLLFKWSEVMRYPFFKLENVVRKCCGKYGPVSRKELEDAGFTAKKLDALQNQISEYIGPIDHTSLQLINAIRTAPNAYYAVGQDFSLFLPRIRNLHGKTQPATFLFSGTASLSPELSKNPDIQSFPDRNLESFQRLQINVQHGDVFNASKSGLEKKRNLFSIIEWLRFVLPQIAQAHKRILLVTYKSYSAALWSALQDFYNVLIPYIGADGQAKPMLPYFGGMNGSNLYREATCVVCVGLNRFEPRDYICRTLALDFDGTCKSEIDAAMEVEEGRVRLDSFPSVMAMQDITLARDIVQLIFRSALRNHGESQPIELWLLQPPNGVLDHLRDYFGDCQIQEFADLPESCVLAAAINRDYKGAQTHAGKLLSFLEKAAVNKKLTPTQIREATGLSREQFKEARKHSQVRRYFKEHMKVSGSGKNAVYTKTAD